MCIIPKPITQSQNPYPGYKVAIRPKIISVKPKYLILPMLYFDALTNANP